MAVPDLTLTRHPDAHKGDHGYVLVIGGSASFPNTPGIVGLAALRTGVDLVRLAAPTPATASVRTALNMTLITLPDDLLRPAHINILGEEAAHAACVAIGPGLGTDDTTLTTIRKLLATIETPVVVDADALTALQDHTSMIKRDWVLTPHHEEFARLTGDAPAADVKTRGTQVKAFAAETRATILLKGATDIISDGRLVETNTTGNPYMTRGGTGDLLTGVVAALRAQGVDPVPAAHTAAYLNGVAGDLALTKYGPGFLLEEMAAELSTALQRVTEE